MAKLEPYKGGYYLWNYLPSIPAAVIFALLFAIATGITTWRMWKTRSWFCTAFVVGGLFQVIGYCCRVAAHDQTGKIMPYVTQNVLIILGAPLFAASIYMVLGRLIVSVRGEKHSIIRPKWLTTMFVVGDVTSLLVQASAGGLVAKEDTMKIGEKVILAGLFIQIIIFGLFIVTTFIFHRRMEKDDTSRGSCSPDTIPWRSILFMLYAVGFLIMFRSTFRVVEYIMGHDGYPLKNEWTLYVFDSVPMFIVMVVFCTWFPSQAAHTRLPHSDEEEAAAAADRRYAIEMDDDKRHGWTRVFQRHS